MNFEVLLLFINATLSVLLAAFLVLRILRRDYLPTLRRLQRAQSDSTPEVE